MKPVKLSAFVFSLCLSASAIAQPPEGRRPEGRGPEGRGAEGRPGEGGAGGRDSGRFRMPNPLLDAIDKDRNGELSAEEIADAAVALKTLDKNNDGKLDLGEMRPNFEGMGRGGAGGPGGPGGPGGEAGAEGAQMVQRLLEMDANKDGKLQKDEVPERLQSMFARGDKNTDGVLDKEEMMATVRDRAGQAGTGGPGGSGFGGGDFAGQLMERADRDKDGKLSSDELPPFMKERLEQIDTNKDGSVDKAELEAGAARMRGGRGEGGGRGGEGGRGERGQRPPVEGEEGEKKSE